MNFVCYLLEGINVPIQQTPQPTEFHWIPPLGERDMWRKRVYIRSNHMCRCFMELQNNTTFGCFHVHHIHLPLTHITWLSFVLVLLFTHILWLSFVLFWTLGNPTYWCTPCTSFVFFRTCKVWLLHFYHFHAQKSFDPYFMVKFRFFGRIFPSLATFEWMGHVDDACIHSVKSHVSLLRGVTQ